MRKVSVCLMIFLVLVLAFNSLNAKALSCAEPSHPLEEMEYSEIVFKGVLASESKNKLYFEVDTVWKGEVGKKISLYQNFWTEFTPGDEYIVFAGQEDGKLRPKLCGNTALASPYIENQLGNPIPLVERAIPSWISIITMSSLIILIVGFVYWIRKR